ncbi:hypothetical protein ACHAWX_004044, partial [Stephanocyclus meneghinianus]
MFLERGLSFRKARGRQMGSANIQAGVSSSFSLLFTCPFRSTLHYFPCIFLFSVTNITEVSPIFRSKSYFTEP